MYFLYLFVNFFLARERRKLFVDARNIKLVAQIRDFLIPQLDHVHYSIVKVLSLMLDQYFQMLLRLFVMWKHLSELLNV